LLRKPCFTINLGSQLLASLQKLPSVWARKHKDKSRILPWRLVRSERSGCYVESSACKNNLFWIFQTRFEHLTFMEKGQKALMFNESIENPVILASRTIGELQPKFVLGVVKSWCAKRTAMVNALNPWRRGKKALSSFQLHRTILIENGE